MKIALDIPETLINEVMNITGAKTKSQAIISALENMINEKKRLKLLSFKGKVDLDIDLDALRRPIRIH